MDAIGRPLPVFAIELRKSASDPSGIFVCFVRVNSVVIRLGSKTQITTKAFGGARSSRTFDSGSMRPRAAASNPCGGGSRAGTA
jgi:hypothetical protein